MRLKHSIGMNVVTPCTFTWRQLVRGLFNVSRSCDIHTNVNQRATICNLPTRYRQNAITRFRCDEIYCNNVPGYYGDKNFTNLSSFCRLFDCIRQTSCRLVATGTLIFIMSKSTVSAARQLSLQVVVTCSLLLSFVM